MQRFNNILFVGKNLDEETLSLKRAVITALENSAKLKIMMLMPQISAELDSYAQKYNDYLNETLTKKIQETAVENGFTYEDLNYSVESEKSDVPATEIVRHVVRQKYDLLIKSAEFKENRRGYKAIDMDLLRKCPCPVWLCDPNTDQAQNLNIAVAVDPLGTEKAAEDLAITLLQISASIAEKNKSVLNIISCWSFQNESYLRNNPWYGVSEEALDKEVKAYETEHRQKLDEFIQRSGIKVEYEVHHIKGSPEKVIPQAADEKDIGLMIMGTVARTGIPGFIMGNTAENILQELDCSLLALKPNGFVSPVNAYK